MTEERDDRTAEQIDTIDRIRSSLATGFAFVRSREVTASVAAITFEESLSGAIDDIETDESDIRRSKLTEVRAIRQETVDAVDQARRLPASAFVSRGGQGNANTPVDGEEPEESGQ